MRLWKTVTCRLMQYAGIAGCILLAASLPLIRQDAMAQESQPTFCDRTAELGLQLTNSQACWFDVDRDGLADLCAGGVVWKNNEGNGFVGVPRSV